MVVVERGQRGARVETSGERERERGMDATPPGGTGNAGNVDKKTLSDLYEAVQKHVILFGLVLAGRKIILLHSLR